MVIIRPYEARDLPALREICVLTGYRGGDSRGVMTDTALLPDAYAEPYVVYDPGLAFVADDDGQAVGYVIGTADTVAFADWYRDVWLPRVAPKHAPPPETAGNFQDAILRDLHNPARMVLADLAGHPAHLHIDLLAGYQGQGLGRQLMETFLAALRARGVARVHLGMDPANVRARPFYDKLGFTPIPVPSQPDAVYLGRYLGRSSGG